ADISFKYDGAILKVLWPDLGNALYYAIKVEQLNGALVQSGVYGTPMLENSLRPAKRNGKNEFSLKDLSANQSYRISIKPVNAELVEGAWSTPQEVSLNTIGAVLNPTGTAPSYNRIQWSWSLPLQRDGLLGFRLLDQNGNT